MRDKLVSLDEAASIVRDGNQVAMSSGFTWSPMAMLRQLARRGVKDLHVICRGGSINVDFLVGTGQAAIVESCSLGFAPYARVCPNFDRYLKAGRVFAKDNTWGIQLVMIQAGSMGIPYAPVLGLAGSDLYARRDDVTMATNPFDPEEESVIVRALNPDVAILHASKADRTGNALLRWHPDNEDLQVARASRRVIITAEEIVDQVSPRDPSGVYIPTINVSAVVHTPGGAHPTGVTGRYEMDKEHIMEYQRRSVSDEEFKQYLDKYVYGVAEEQYAERFGPLAVRV